MRSLVGALRVSANIGDPLPTVFVELMQMGVEFRRGSVALIASAPGVGKSIFANVLALRARVPTLYLSADTDAFTVATRVGAHMTRRTTTEIEQEVGSPEFRERIQKLDWIRWGFDSNMDIEDIARQVEAFDVMYGEPPWLLVVDNLSSMTSDEGNPFLAHRYNVEMLNVLARETGACVVVLHHLTGFYESGNVPPDQGSLEGKVAKVPSLVLGLFNGNAGDLGVTIVKNRFGDADAGGKLRVFLTVDKSRLQIGAL